MLNKGKFVGRSAGLVLAGLLSSMSIAVAQGLAGTEPAPGPGADVAAPAPAITGSAAPPEAGGIEEIIVTAQRRSESAQNVPISISAFSGDDLKRLAVESPQDLQFSTPGLTFPADNGTISPYIRGRGANFAGPGLEGPVAIYIDDVYLESQFGANSLLDIAQVQVLKGPQGSLYGRNATGGAVLITTANPTHERDGYVKAGYGNLDDLTTEAMLNLPLGDTLAIRVVGGYEKRDGYVDNVVNGDKVGGFDRRSVRLKALWEPIERLSVLLKTQYQLSNQGYLRQLLLDGTGTPTGLGFYQTEQSPRNAKEDNAAVWDNSLQVNYNTDTWALANTLGYRNLDLKLCIDNDFTYPRNNVFCDYTAPNPSEPNGVEDSYDRTLVDDLRLTTQFTSPVNVLLGASAQKTDARFAGVVEGNLYGGYMPVFDNSTKLHSYAAYAELYYQATKRLKLTLGGRYTRDQKDLTVDNNADSILLLGLPPSFAHFPQSDSWSRFTPRVVLAYDAGLANYYLSYNQGFKSGGFNVPTPAPQTPLDPETTSGFELGTKMKLLDNRARLNLALFTATTKGTQVASIDSVTSSVVQQNAAKVKASGVEAGFDLLINEALTLQTGAAYLNAKFDSFPNAQVYSLQNGVLAAASEDISGQQTPNSPKFTANAGLTYKFKLDSGWSNSTTLSGYYTSSYLFNAGAGGPLGADRQDSYALFNLTGQIAAPGGKLSLEWYVKNLTDKEYYDRVQTNASFGVFGVSAVPRTYGAAIRYSFF